MELTELVHDVQKLSQEAGLAVNMAEKEKAMAKLQELFELLDANTTLVIEAESDEVGKPIETSTLVQAESADEKPAEPGPEAQPSEE